MQYESSTTLSAHFQWSKVMSFPRWHPCPSMQIINQRANSLREQSERIHLILESINPTSKITKNIQFPQIQCEIRLQLMSLIKINQILSLYLWNIPINITIMFTLAFSHQDCSQPLAGLLILKLTRFSFQSITIPPVSRLDACLDFTSAFLHLWRRFIRKMSWTVRVVCLYCKTASRLSVPRAHSTRFLILLIEIRVSIVLNHFRNHFFLNTLHIQFITPNFPSIIELSWLAIH